MRGVSTVLDATLFLLLVSGATVALVGPQPTPPTSDAPDRTLAVVTTATTTVSYRVPAVERGGTDGHREAGRGGTAGHRGADRRTTQGTIAELLAAAAIEGAPDSIESPSRLERTPFQRAVANATRVAVRRTAVETRVRVTWVPYRGAPAGSRFAVGPEPPRATDVHAAAATVPSGLPTVRRRAVRAGKNGSYEAVAATVARGVVSGLFPVRRTRLALAADRAVARPTRRRYGRVARALAVPVADALGDRDVEAADGRLIGALTARYAADLRDRYASPSAAARAVRVGRVRIVVRTWSP
ncbi:MAG: hypothetical protein ABEI96_06040 [Haloarculaceae archaeon]